MVLIKGYDAPSISFHILWIEQRLKYTLSSNWLAACPIQCGEHAQLARHFCSFDSLEIKIWTNILQKLVHFALIRK